MHDTRTDTRLAILEVAASGRNEGSVSRMLSADLVGALEARHGSVEVTRRALNRGLPFVDEASTRISRRPTSAPRRSAPRSRSPTRWLPN